MNGISVKVLHSWLMTIPPENLGNPSARDKLYKMQKELAEVIYAWMGRQGVPEDIREEEESRLPVETRQLYDDVLAAKLNSEDARDLAELAHGRIDQSEEAMKALAERLEKLELLWKSQVEEHINKFQQGQYLTWVRLIGDLLTRRKEGTYRDVEAYLKTQFQFVSYRLIPASQFEEIRQYCIGWWKRLSPPGAPLPPAFNDPSQQRLF